MAELAALRKEVCGRLRECVAIGRGHDALFVPSCTILKILNVKCSVSLAEKSPGR